MNKHELKSLLENIYRALTEELTLDQVLDQNSGEVELGTTNDLPGVRLEPRPKGWVGPWPPGTPSPPKPFWLDPEQLGVPRNPDGTYDWARFWERHRLV
jgi:hypothetical protein